MYLEDGRLALEGGAVGGRGADARGGLSRLCLRALASLRFRCCLGLSLRVTAGTASDSSSYGAL